MDVRDNELEEMLSQLLLDPSPSQVSVAQVEVLESSPSFSPLSGSVLSVTPSSGVSKDGVDSGDNAPASLVAKVGRSVSGELHPPLVSREETTSMVQKLKAALPSSTDDLVASGQVGGSFQPSHAFAIPLLPRVSSQSSGSGMALRTSSHSQSCSGDERPHFSPDPQRSHCRLATFQFFVMGFSLLFCFILALTVISVNVNGLRDGDKRLGFLQWLPHLSPLVVCLQETHAVSNDDLLSWFSRFGYLCAGSFGTNHSRGVVVLYHLVFECRSVVCKCDGCFVLVEFSLGGSVFVAASIYAPNCNPDCDAFFVRCIDSIDPAVSTLLCGDFNTDLDRVPDRRGSCPFDVSRESSALLSAMFSNCCVLNIWRQRHPNDSAFTWFRPDGALASHIDLIGCPYAWVPYVSSADILPCPFSDHCALSFSWALPNSVPLGPGLWKLNRSVLDEAEYIDLISIFWSYWWSRQSSFSSLTGWWDSGKSHIKRISINYCVNRSKSKLVERDILSKLATHLKVHIDSGRLSFLHVYLRALDLEVARGAQVCARSRWVEEGESSSAYFFRLEKKKDTDCNISALRASDGTLVADKDGLCDVFRSFYLDLFSAAPCDSNAELLSNISSVLPFDDSEVCKGLLSQEECFAALQGMAHGKAPGCDGLLLWNSI